MAVPTESVLHIGSAHPPSRASARPKALTKNVLSELIKLIDLCSILAASAGAYLAFLASNHASLAGGFGRYALPSLAGGGLFMAAMEYSGGYRIGRLKSARWQIRRVAAVWLIALSALITAAFVGKLSALYSRFWVSSWTLFAFTLLISGRMLLAHLLCRFGRHFLRRNVAVVGALDLAEGAAARLANSPDEEIVVCGVFDEPLSADAGNATGQNARGGADDLLLLAKDIDIDDVILALPLGDGHRLKALVNKFKQLPGSVVVNIASIGEAAPIRRLRLIGSLPTIEIIDPPIRHWGAVLKWAEDKLLAALILALSMPLIVITAVLIKLDSRGPVFFLQDRVGFNNKIIKVIKFRTMYVDSGDPSGGRRTVRGDPRVTRIGRLLRRMSFDEVPQVINVLKGDMSLVGPRPHAVAMKIGDRFYPDAVHEYAQRHRVKPGITGLAQIYGLRGEIDSLEKGRARVDYDLQYIESWSAWLDLKILVRTLPAVLSTRNAY
jgi:Undecaprenyl-phosphate glucose phosphotransferase